VVPVVAGSVRRSTVLAVVCLNYSLSRVNPTVVVSSCPGVVPVVAGSVGGAAVLAVVCLNIR
jgi:hypothetical protein